MKNIKYVLLVLLAVLSASCNQSSKKKEMIRKELYGSHMGKEVFLFTLTNKAGNVIRLTNFGGKITWIEIPDRNGKKDNVTFGYDRFEDMINGDMSFGSVVGRYANRIADGKFTLDGEVYTLPVNNGPNCLHGGPAGWHSVVWDAEILRNSDNPAVRFTYLSPDMEEGFPGNVQAEVIYTWTDKNEIVMDYKCTTDKKTVLNVTNHAYFNLHGAGNGNILDHELVIRASAFTPVDSVMIPTGEIRPVAGTPFDFTTPHTIGERINDDYEQLILGRGYDHNFVLDIRPAAGCWTCLRISPACSSIQEIFLTGALRVTVESLTITGPVSAWNPVTILTAPTIRSFLQLYSIREKHSHRGLFTDFQ
jgi:aldose 1-epimerase